MDYPEIAANVPLPTFEQTIRFADHVASNRSWYKHLPLFSPGDSFVFFLNPNAGMGVQQKDGVYKVYSIERADYFQHHSRLATADYLASFGHWDYWVVENRRNETWRPRPNLLERFRELYRPPLPPERTAEEGPWIYRNDSADRLTLPGNLWQKSQCRFTAFLKPSPTLFQIKRDAWHRALQAFQVYARKFPSDPEVVRYMFLARAIHDGKGLGGKIGDVWSTIFAEHEKQRERWFNVFRFPNMKPNSERESSQQEPGIAASRSDHFAGRGADDRIDRHIDFNTMLSFMESESTAQKEKLLQKLRALREFVKKGE